MQSEKKTRVVLALSLALTAFASLFLLSRPTPPLDKKFGGLSWKLDASSQYSIGSHRIAVDHSLRRILVSKGDRIIWSSLAGKSFLGGSTGALNLHEDHGSFKLSYDEVQDCGDQSVAEFLLIKNIARVSGQLHCPTGTFNWLMDFSENKNGDLDLKIVADPTLSRVFWRIQSDANERIFGAGSQYTHFDLKGHILPVWASEQGIGRGLEPLTTLMNLIANSGGTPFTTYLASGQFITSRWRGMVVHNSSYGEFDFRDDQQIVFDYWNHQAHLTVISDSEPKSLLTQSTLYTGRMRALPDWVHRGAILGLQGGSEKVMRVLNDFSKLQTPIAGLWIQDWVGQRRTSIGKQLWWNWELNRSHYSDWENVKAKLRERDIRLLAYINPFLVDLPDHQPRLRSLIDEAREKDFLVRNAKSDELRVAITSFDASMIDLSNPEAREWIKKIIREQMIREGFSGWMADFGEALPTDAKLKNASAYSYHNLYPVEWAKVNREAIESLPDSGEFVFFARSGFTESPAYATLFWTGDQLVTWDQFDGIKTALTSLLSSGISGAVFNHSDIGGYTAFRLPLFSVLRSEELLVRWMELNAFTPIFRTHEGNQPENNVQVFDHERIRQRFSQMARLYASLFEYRKELVSEAANKGWPMVRPMWLEYPEDPAALSLSKQFMLGSKILVAPVLDPGVSVVEVYFPPGRWRHVITGEMFDIGKSARRLMIRAPLGTPAAFRQE